jgi:tellurite resistance protein TehA-like permease
MSNAAAQGVKGLPPGYFALVMATGILSLAAFYSGWGWTSGLLFHLNQVAYAALWILTLVRLIWFRPYLTADLVDHSRGPGFFTNVAGTCVLGAQFMVLARDPLMGTLLWFLGILVWVLIMYSFFTAVMIGEVKPNLPEGLTGGWLIAIVSTQSISILGVLIAPFFSPRQEPFLFFALTLFLLGGMLYILIILLVFYRLTFFPLTYQEFSPLYWINMGAIAITTLAGATLIQNSSYWPFLQEILPFLKGFTLFFWITGTWWIPLLVILMIWRHLVRRFPVKYTPEYWAMVFPLGMYSTGTYQLAKAAGFSFLFPLSRGFFYLALITWLLTFCGMVRRLARMSGLTTFPEQNS